MALVTEDRIDELLRETLGQYGVSDAVKEVELFPTPSGVLAEVVLVDASVLEKAQKAVQEVERALEEEGVSLLTTVRALWQVEDVERVGIAYPAGTPPDTVGALFKGRLRSGGRQQEVWVSVTPSAQRVLRPLTTTGRVLGDLVRAFLRRWLSVGGAGYWDPIHEQKLELGESAAGYLRWRPYEQLRGSVDLVFDSLERTRGLLRSFNELGEKALDFTKALPKVAGPRGAYASGERLPTSNYELYEMLLASEKDELTQYYLDRLRRAGKDWPELKQEFPKAFVE